MSDQTIVLIGLSVLLVGLVVFLVRRGLVRRM